MKRLLLILMILASTGLFAQDYHFGPGVIFVPSSVAPTPVQEGHFYYNDVDKVFYVWDGSAWISPSAGDNLGDHTATQDLEVSAWEIISNKDIVFRADYDNNESRSHWIVE